MIAALLNFAIHRRTFTLSLGLIVIGLGLFSLQRLPIDAVPDITNVQVQINTEAPGYSPLESEQRITYPIENALAGLPRLDHTRSLSRYGLSQVTVIFKDGTDIYFARNLIDEKLSAIKNQIPSGLEPQLGPIATGLGEIFTYVVYSEPGAKDSRGAEYTTTSLREIQDWVIKPQLAQTKGVVEINTIGGFDKQYHVYPWPTKMLTYGISLEDITTAIQNNNLNTGAGFIEKNGQQLLIRAVGQLTHYEQLKNIAIKEIDNIPITLQEVADIGIGKELRSGAATYNGQQTVMGTAMMLMGENARTVSQALTQKMAEIENTLPQGVKVEVVYNRTGLVEKTLITVQKNLLEGALLVIAVLFLLLGNIRAAVITAAIIPLSMLATIFGMEKLGVSANLMSLGALDFGLIVDGSVIVVENTIRRLSQAHAASANRLELKERLQVVFEASNEVIRPSLFGVFIITLVYIPIFSLSGVEGKMFQPMAMTVIIALLAAMIFSITIVPAAVALFIRGNIQENENLIIRKTKSIYVPLLKVALRYKKMTLLSAASLVVLCLWLATKLGSEFIPQLDEGDIALHAMRISGTGLEQATEMQQSLEQALLEFQEVDKVFSKVGTPEVATDPMPPNVADTFVILKNKEDWADKNKDKTTLLKEMENKLQTVPGNNYEFTQPIQMRFNELISGVRSDLGIKIFGDDLDTLINLGQQVLNVIQDIDGAADTKVEQITKLPTLTILPKRDALARYGASVEDLNSTAAIYFGGYEASSLYEGDRQFKIVVRLPESLRTDIEQIKHLPLYLDSGQYVPLSEVAQIELLPAPNKVSRENGKRRIVVSANVRGRDLGGFVDEVKQQIQNQIQLPPGYWINYGGTFEQFESASQRLGVIVPVTLLVIIALLILALSSLKDALIVFSGVPLALTGGIIALWLRDMPFSISAGVGFIALSGVAVLNGLVLIAFIQDLRRENHSIIDSVVQGAQIRLRPIMMTALVASLGFLPMALNTGTGAEVQRPIATVVIGGIISSTLLTLFVLPALYTSCYGNHRKR